MNELLHVYFVVIAWAVLGVLGIVALGIVFVLVIMVACLSNWNGGSLDIDIGSTEIWWIAKGIGYLLVILPFFYWLFVLNPQSLPRF